MYIPTFDDVIAAHERIKPYIHRTPVLTSSYLNQLTGAELFFKCENFQKAGAFKVRGASNAVFGLQEDQLAKGVATHSSGNHALSLSYAAGRRGIPCSVVPHAFPDHHAYAAPDFDFGSRLPVLMTAKDAVKCAGLVDAQAFMVPVEAVLPEPFWLALLDRLPARSR